MKILKITLKILATLAVVLLVSYVIFTLKKVF